MISRELYWEFILTSFCFMSFAIGYVLINRFMIVFFFCMFCFLFCVFCVLVLCCLSFLPVYKVLYLLFVYNFNDHSGNPIAVNKYQYHTTTLQHTRVCVCVCVWEVGEGPATAFHYQIYFFYTFLPSQWTPSQPFPVTSFAVHASSHPTDDTASLNNPSTSATSVYHALIMKKQPICLRSYNCLYTSVYLRQMDTDLQKSTTRVLGIRLQS